MTMSRQYIRKLLGDHLVPSLAEANIGKTWTRVNPNLPSPLDLKFKILIKHKKRPSQEDKTEAPKPSVSAIAKVGPCSRKLALGIFS